MIPEQRLSFITLGVNNLENMKNFYLEKFGWTPLKDSDGIVFFKLNGVILSLFPWDELAEDASVPSDGHGFKGFTLAIALRSVKEVDELFQNFRGKAVKIVKLPETAVWGGYSGYVKDIENNLWEFAYNPFLEMDDIGNVTGHK